MEHFVAQLVIFVLACFVSSQAHKNWYWWGGNPSNPLQGTKICSDGNQVQITCPNDYVIDIQWATYSVYYNRFYCGDANAFFKVEDICNGRNSCQFTCDDQLFNETTCNQSSEILKACYKCIQDPCNTFYCANGGTCRVTTDLKPVCECLGSWNGTHCDDNPCNGVVCTNGTCLVNITDGSAQCCGGETVVEDEENPCDSLTCQNNGTCLVDQEGNAQCCCSTAFTGTTCEILVDACTNNPCANGGNCSVNLLGLAECSCAVGFGGPTCNISCDQVQPCPTGFLELPPNSGNCYFICPNESESWLSAQITCLGLGATLWEPNDNAEVTAVTSSLGGLGSNQYWTGAFDGITEGTTIFVGSGLPFLLTTTGTNTGTKDCVEITRSTLTSPWEFQYRTCTVETRRCLCEKPKPCQTTATVPIVPDPA